VPPEREGDPKVTYQIRGAAAFDTATKTFTAFDVTVLAEKGHFERGTKKWQGLGITFELIKPERPADRLPPFFVNEKGYWDTGN
jgi:hypothetical protein